MLDLRYRVRGWMSAALFAVMLAGFVPPVFGQSVALSSNTTAFTLDNGLASVTVQKADGKVTIFKLNGGPNLLSSGSGSVGLYYDVILGSGSDSYSGQGVWSGGTPVYTVTAQTSGMVDVELRNAHLSPNTTLYPNGLYDMALHFVMRAGDTGFYTYSVWRHGAGYPAAFLGFPRQVVRAAPLFSSNATATAWEFSTENKIGQCIGGDLLTDEITDQVYKLPMVSYYTEPVGHTEDGYPTWSKYDWGYHQGGTTSSSPVYGAANDQYGLWVVRGSQESFNGGPGKMKAGAQGATFILDYSESHATTGAIDNAVAASETMEKMFGPVFIYANSGGDHSALWQDAQARGQREIGDWPYAWVTESETTYPRNRGSVTGRFYMPGLTSTPAVVVLGAPGVDWRNQGAKNYLFWTTADADGRFDITKVRPGNYTLYAWTPGALDEFSLPNVQVTANQTTDVGLLTFHPARRERFLWRLGTPDRSTEEFKWGDTFKQFGLWWRYQEERGTNELTYIIGQSNPKTDWYYAQFGLPQDDGTYFGTRWNLQFDLASVPPTPGLLTVALAGARTGAFHVEVNGTNLVTSGIGATYTGSDISGTQNITNTGIVTADDSGVDRDAIRSAWYRYYQIQFPTSLLHTGTNTITIRVRKTGASTWSGVKPVLPSAGIMYDCVQLEAGAALAPGNVTWQDAGHAGVWDANNTTDWLRSGNSSVFTQGDAVTFDDSGFNGTAIALAGPMAPGTFTVDSAKDYTLTGPGSLVGLMDLAKSGTGVLTLSGNHTYEGNTTITAGKIALAGNLTNHSFIEVLAGGELNVTGNLALDTLFVRAGGKLAGDGHVTGRVVNEGVVDIGSGPGAKLSITGNLDNTGTVRLTNGSGLAVSGTLNNSASGTLDVITGAPPTYGALINEGIYVDLRQAQATSFFIDGTVLHLTVPSQPGHNYQLQRADSLDAPDWVDVGSPQAGTGAPLDFTDTQTLAGPPVFLRILISP